MLPVFVSVKFCVDFCPAVTLPKLIVVGDTVKLAVPEACVFCPTSPAQPFVRRTGTSAITTSAAFCHILERRRSFASLVPTVPT
jgi:hypothetical protein